MPNLSKRNRLPEWMDQPDIDPALHHHALKGLARLNYFSNGAGVLWKPIFNLANKRNLTNLSMLDVATGSGDIPIALSEKAFRSNINIDFSVVDKSPFAIKLVQSKCKTSNIKMECLEMDVLDGPAFPEHDIIICSLFLHHLDNGEAIKLMQRMAQSARIAIFINDLERSWLNWNMVWVSSHLLTRSPVVHMDGPRSVAGAFTAKEALKLASDAGLKEAEVQSCFPCRFLLSWVKL